MLGHSERPGGAASRRLQFSPPVVLEPKHGDMDLTLRRRDHAAAVVAVAFHAVDDAELAVAHVGERGASAAAGAAAALLPRRHHVVIVHGVPLRRPRAAAGRDLAGADGVPVAREADPGVELGVEEALAMERQEPATVPPPLAALGVHRVRAAAAVAGGGDEDGVAVGVHRVGGDGLLERRRRRRHGRVLPRPAAARRQHLEGAREALAERRERVQPLAAWHGDGHPAGEEAGERRLDRQRGRARVVHQRRRRVGHHDDTVAAHGEEPRVARRPRRREPGGWPDAAAVDNPGVVEVDVELVDAVASVPVVEHQVEMLLLRRRRRPRPLVVVMSPVGLAAVVVVVVPQPPRHPERSVFGRELDGWFDPL